MRAQNGARILFMLRHDIITNFGIMKSKVLACAIWLLASMAWAGPKVDIKFDRFHGYTGTVEYLKAVQKAYPGITELLEIGKSVHGRPMYVLAITNKKTGTTVDREKKLQFERKLEVPNPPVTALDQGKAAYMITGCTHGNELTGNEVCLYFIDKMVSGYDTDPEIKQLIDNRVFYVCPAINVDGLYNTVELGATQRVNSMNGFGTQRKDLNGDGKWSQVRYKDPKGYYRIDPEDPRLMTAIRSVDEVPESERYSVIWETESDKGIDLNRNFPEAWWNMQTRMPAGSGEYATSAPETQAICEFIITHTNILMVNEYHTQGGYTYRPLGCGADKGMNPRDVVVYDQILGKKYQELMGVKDLHTAWRAAYSNTASYAGLLLDWLYKQCGIYSMATELWNPAHEIAELKDLKGAELQKGILKYVADKGLYLPWKPAKHPVHGNVEVGGWLSAPGPNNAYPGEPLLKICERQYQFDRYCISLLPQMDIQNVSAKVTASAGGTKVVEITADIVNTGALPSGLQNTENMAFCRGDVAWLVGANNKMKVISGEACTRLGNLYGTKQIPGFRGPNKQTVKWVVAVEGNEALKIVASSLKGGTVVKPVKY